MPENVTIYGTTLQTEAMTGENVTNDSQSVANVDTVAANATSPNKDENQTEGSPTQGLSPQARGNGATTQSAVSKANQNVKHVCSIPEIVQSAIFKAGALGGKIVKAIREGIKALLEFFGVSPSSNGIVQYLRKVINWIKDGIKWMKDTLEYVVGFLQIVEAIKAAIMFILSLPAKLLVYFKDCLSLMYSLLKAGYLDAVGADVSMTDVETQELIKTFGELRTETGKLVDTATKLYNTTQQATNSITSFSVGSVETPETWQQSVNNLNSATEQYYTDNGYTKPAEPELS